MVTCATVVPVVVGTYCTVIVQLAPGATERPATQVPPVLEKVPVLGPVLVTVGFAVKTNGPAFAPLALLVTVMVPVFVVVVAGAVVNAGVGAEKLIAPGGISVVKPVSATD
jgi:hypothetical protein